MGAVLDDRAFVGNVLRHASPRFKNLGYPWGEDFGRMATENPERHKEVSGRAMKSLGG